MTDLRKAIQRRTVKPYDHHARRLVIMLEPGDVISIKPERTRKWFSAPLEKIYWTVLQWNVDAERAAKRAERKARR